jgi:hypothetical protein
VTVEERRVSAAAELQNVAQRALFVFHSRADRRYGFGEEPPELLPELPLELPDVVPELLVPLVPLLPALPGCVMIVVLVRVWFQGCQMKSAIAAITTIAMMPKIATEELPLSPPPTTVVRCSSMVKPSSAEAVVRMMFCLEMRRCKHAPSVGGTTFRVPHERRRRTI